MPTLYNQSRGNQGIAETLQHMKRLTDGAFIHPAIRRLAVKAAGHCPPNDKRCQAASILNWVQRKVRFVRDPQGVEALHDPVMLAIEIERGGKPFGDCDDFSMLIAALLRSIGIPATFRAVGFNGGHLSHVYVVGPYGMKLDATKDPWNPQLGEFLPETSSMEYGA